MGRFTTSHLSTEAGRKRPGRKLLCSTQPGWRSLLVQTYEQPNSVDRYETLASPDFLVVLVESGRYEMECLSAGTWKKAVYRPGVAGITAPMTTNRLRWRSSTDDPVRLIRTYIPAGFFEEAIEEFRKAGSGQRVHCEDLLAFSDPLVTATVHSLVSAIGAGLPDIYAETAARHLATHLVARAIGWQNASAGWAGRGDLTDVRLRRTLDFMACNFAERLTVEQLAKEAGISRFHFCRLFKTAVGVSPHQHLSRLRIAHARDLLGTTTLPIAEVVAECGYTHTGHFAAAFSKTVGQTPSEYRRMRGLR